MERWTTLYYSVQYSQLTYLSKGHYVMLNVGSRDSLGMFTVISNDNGDCWIVSSHTVNEILELVVTEKCFSGYGDKGTDIVF